MRGRVPFHVSLPHLVLILAVTLVGTAVDGSTIGHRAAIARDEATPTGSPLMESPPAARLIEAARQEGAIDYPAALRYRAYALTGDSRLPATFAAAPIGEDPTIWREIRAVAPLLPPVERAELESYLLRPTDPRSPLHGASEITDETTAPPSGVGASSDPVCAGNWVARRSTANPGSITVWARCDDAFDADTAKALALLDGLWGPMTDLMGPPLPDRGGTAAGGDAGLDVYLPELAETVRRRGEVFPAPYEGWGSLAYAVEDAPFTGDRASGFIVMDRAVLDRADLRGTLAHEFFHILQYAHNYEIAARETGEVDAQGFPILEFNWVFEATANWAHTHFVPETAVAAIHGVSFAQCFQYLDVSLHLSRTSAGTDADAACHAYGAYIWFYFVEQDLGDPAFMKAIWDAIAATDDWDGLMAAIDAQHSFADHFREFAVRNLNLELQPGDPIDPSYRDRDPNFPIAGPLIQNPGAAGRLAAQADGEAPRVFDKPIAPLAAHYYRFTVAAESGRVVVDLRGLATRAALEADVVVKVAGRGWERRRVDPAAPLVFCRADPSEAVEEFYLILSNHERALDATVAGAFSVASRAAGCDG